MALSNSIRRNIPKNIILKINFTGIANMNFKKLLCAENNFVFLAFVNLTFWLAKV